MSTYSQQPRIHTRTNAWAIASLVCGILGLIVFGIILGPIAIGLGAMAMRSASRDGLGSGRNLAIAGLVLGVVDIVGFFVALALINS